jgi:anti-anti-sigma regulatory factor
MALFFKPPSKKPSGTPAGNVRPLTVVGRTPSRKPVHGAPGKPRPAERRGSNAIARAVPMTVLEAAIEVASPSPNPILCSVLENAALAYASGHAAEARALLEAGIADDAAARGSRVAWHALLDVLQRTNDRAAFDLIAMKYVVHFERSAPAWQDGAAAEAPARAAGTSASAAPQGRITAANAAQLLGWSRLKGEADAPPRVDLLGVTGFDDAGARLLADALAGLRRRRTPVLLEHVDKLRFDLDNAVERGLDAGNGPWLLLLELLQWQGEQATFDDRAVEYAVTFEVSPPSWEPPALEAAPQAPASIPLADAIDAGAADPENTFAWSGEVTGTSPEALRRLLEFAQTRPRLLLDMREVKRIDFASAGALMNAMNRLGQQGKPVRIVRASAILQALLFVLGISPQQFAGKPA